METKELDALIKEKKPLGVFVFHGEEDYMADYYIKKIAQIIEDGGFADLDLRRLWGGSYDASDFCDAVLTLPVGSDFSLTIVRDADFSGFSDKDKALAAECLGRAAAGGACVILRVRSLDELEKKPKRVSAKKKAESAKTEAKMSLAEFLLENAKLCEFAPNGRQSLIRWQKNVAKAAGVAIADDLCGVLLERCGLYMYNLKNEIDKLAAYAAGCGRVEITADDVELLTPKKLDLEAFEFSNALMAKDYAKSLSIITKHKYARDEATVPLGIVTRHFCDVFAVHSAVKSGVSDEVKIAALTGIHEYRVKLYKAYLQRLKSPDTYIAAALACCKFCDLAVKSTSMGDYMLLESLMCRLSGL